MDAFTDTNTKQSDTFYTDSSDKSNPKQYKIIHKLASGRYGEVLKVQLIKSKCNGKNDENTNDENIELSEPKPKKQRLSNPEPSKSRKYSKEKPVSDNDEDDDLNIFAIKCQEIFDNEISDKVQREIDIMLKLKTVKNNQNIMKMMSHFIDSNCLLILLPFYDSNLQILLTNAPLEIKMIKKITYQCMNGLAAIHSLNIIHRDIKPNNILYDTHSQTICIADFGSARDITQILKESEHKNDDQKKEDDILKGFDDPNWSGFDDDDGSKLSPQVYVVMYRAPELLVGERHYSFGIDVWAMGCIMAQMCLKDGKLLFDEDHDIPLFLQQIKILGGPPKDALENVGLFSTFFCMDAAPYKEMKDVIPWLGEQSESGCDLLAKVLRFGPKERICAKDALKHSFFDDLKK